MADILVQRGTNDIGNTGGTDTGFTEVSALTAAFEYNANSMFTHGGSTSSGGNMEGDDMSGGVELTATDTLTFTRQSGSLAQNMRHDWQLLEYTGSGGGANEFIVRSRNTVTLTGSSNTASLDTTPTDIDKCVPFITGVRTSQTSNQGDELRALAYINDSGTLVVEKGSTTSTTVVQVVVVEFTGSNWSVYHGTATSATDTGTITLNTDSDGAGGSTGDVTDWATAFIEGQFTSTDQGLDSIACRYDEGAGTTTVDWDFQSGNSTSHKHFVHVVQNDDMAVTRYTPTGSNAGDTNIDITSAGLTVLAESFIIGTCQGSGGGTAYGRNWRNYRITSLTNAQHYCHRSGNTINHNVQVIDFSAVEDSGGTTVTGSGGATAQSADSSGVGERIVDGTGSATAQPADSSGSGTVTSTHTGSGSATAQDADSAGAGIRVITGTGSAQAQSADSDGSGTTHSSTTGSGGATAQNADSAGAGIRTITGQGSAQSAPAGTSGVGLRQITGGGAATAQGAQADGSGSVGGSVSGSGGATAQGADSSGVGLRIVAGTGTASAQDAESSGSGTVGGAISGSGNAQAQDSQSSGSGLRLIQGSGGAVSQNADSSGTGIIEGAISGSGSAESQSAQSSGAGLRLIAGSGAAEAQESQTFGTGSNFGIVTGSGGATAQSATVSGAEIYQPSPRIFQVEARGV